MRDSIIRQRLAAAIASVLTLTFGGCNDEIASANADVTTVFEGRGARQCQSRGATVQQSALKLIQQGLDVQNSGCGVMRGRAFPAVCGGPTGDILLHDIPAVSLDVAERLGFSTIDSLEGGYIQVNCDTGDPLA